MNRSTKAGVIDLHDHSYTHVKSMNQLVSQLLPSSSEKACSQRADFSVMRDHRKRTGLDGHRFRRRHRRCRCHCRSSSPAERDGRHGVEPVDRPARRLGIVGTQAHATIAAARQVMSASSMLPKPSRILRAAQLPLELNPVVAAGQPSHKIAMAAAPDAHEEIEIGAGLGGQDMTVSTMRPPS